jgi:hypothetical protein
MVQALNAINVSTWGMAERDDGGYYHLERKHIDGMDRFFSFRLLLPQDETLVFRDEAELINGLTLLEIGDDLWEAIDPDEVVSIAPLEAS